MDSGRVRILRNIELHLAEAGIRLQRHMMDAELLAKVGRPADGKGPAPGDRSRRLLTPCDPAVSCTSRRNSIHVALSPNKETMDRLQI